MARECPSWLDDIFVMKRVPELLLVILMMSTMTTCICVTIQTYYFFLSGDQLDEPLASLAALNNAMYAGYLSIFLFVCLY